MKKSVLIRVIFTMLGILGGVSVTFFMWASNIEGGLWTSIIALGSLGYFAAFVIDRLAGISKKEQCEDHACMDADDPWKKPKRGVRMSGVESEAKGDATGGIIPYKNPPALFAYYCAIFSLIPLIGILVGIPGIFLGIAGLRKRRANPIVRGAAHAWIGIILGGLTSLLWGGLIALMVFAIASQ